MDGKFRHERGVNKKIKHYFKGPPGEFHAQLERGATGTAAFQGKAVVWGGEGKSIETEEGFRHVRQSY